MQIALAPAYAKAWETALAFHGHACPGLAMGTRIAVDAMTYLVHSASVNEEMACVAETESCAVDAIQAISGCSLGKGNLVLRLRGKHAFSFFVRERKKAVRFYWHDTMGGGSAEETAGRFLSAPAEELYTIAEPDYAPPPLSRINQPVTCAVCGENTSEPYARLSEGRIVCLDCHYPRPHFIM